MREKSTHNVHTFTLTTDVSKAQRRISIAPCNWDLLGCQVQSGSAVCIPKVCTFGVASASRYWSRVASPLGRLTQCSAGHSAGTRHKLVADDFRFGAGGPEHCPSLVVFIVVIWSHGRASGNNTGHISWEHGKDGRMVCFMDQRGGRTENSPHDDVR